MINQSSPLQNRIKKNLKKIRSYLKSNKIEAFRIYNKEIPEIPYIIDIYKDHAVVYEQGKKLSDEDSFKRESHQSEITHCLAEIFQITKENIALKTREKKKGNEQYNLFNARADHFFSIQEGDLQFWVNLEKYLDTGLFLDHRPLRTFLSKNCKDQNVLNLFCYTGSLSVAAAYSGAKVTSIDLSSTYLDWAKENFHLNKLDLKSHQFIKADILNFLSNHKLSLNQFDKIILDPPSFSNSKSMDDILDVQRDHQFLIQNCMKLLKQDGELYFSTNKRKFELDQTLMNSLNIKEITHWTIPNDFHFSQIHTSFSIKHKHC